jgi:hypothetical protein
MTADEATAGRCSPRCLWRGGRPKPVCRADRGSPSGSDDGDSKQIRQKALRVLKHKGLQFRKKGSLSRDPCSEFVKRKETEVNSTEKLW